MESRWKKAWLNPEGKHRVNAIIHEWPVEKETLMDAVKDYGYGGVVTNPSHKNMYEGFQENIRAFKDIVCELEKRGLGFWIYDESGYPSGYAGGETLKGHPEYEAKGFYMRRFVAYEDRLVRFALDFESDKIIWAAKYPMDISSLHQSYVQYDQMEPVSFTSDYVETSLKKGEAFFVFCVKPAYEGSQCTHNTCSFSRYINIMNPAAVQRFIELMFEPIEKEIPGIFSKARAVFTDEPSLMVGYSRDYEVWPYALAPWVDGLFEAYEKMYGQPIQPSLPLLFEGGDEGATVRINFYRLVGKLIGEAYSGALSAWCARHGGTFSGHYMLEENVYGQVMYYGSYEQVVRRTGYPGLDVLDCVPERFNYNTVKFPQMVARKMNAPGMMVEICPFGCIEEFKKAPYENMTGIMGLLYMSGVRTTNSYFSANFAEYSPEKLAKQTGYMSQAQAQEFNGYIGRMGVMLENMRLKTDVFVYYGYEDVCSKVIPQYTANTGRAFAYDFSALNITRALFEQGHDFLYADSEDLIGAAETGMVHGNDVSVLIVPAVDVIDGKALRAIRALEEKGTKVFFFEKTPHICSGDGNETPVDLVASGREEILSFLTSRDCDFKACPQNMLMKARFEDEKTIVWMLHNGARTPNQVAISAPTKGKIWNPVDGSITDISAEQSIMIAPLHSIFVVYPA